MNLKAISIVIIAGAAGLAAAQTGMKPIGADFRAGAFLPTDSGTQGAGNSWLDLGIDFDVAKLGADAHLSISADYAYRNGFRSLPLLVNYVLRRGPAYAFAGGGGNFNLIPQGDGTVYNTTTLAFDAGIGYDFIHNGGSPIFVEGRFFGDQKAVINGFGVFLGIRI